MSVNTVVREICRLLDYQGGIHHEPARTADAKAHRSSVMDAMPEVESSSTPFEDGLIETIEYYKNFA